MEQMEKKAKAVIPYTQSERKKKISNIIMELAYIGLTDSLTDEIRTNIQKFIDDGTAYEYQGPLEIQGRSMRIMLHNDKNKNTYINIHNDEYNVGDDVDVFVCQWSSDYLKKNLHKPKKTDDSKFFVGKIISIIDNYKVQVKVKNKVLDINVDDILIR